MGERPSDGCHPSRVYPSTSDGIGFALLESGVAQGLGLPTGKGIGFTRYCITRAKAGRYE